MNTAETRLKDPAMLSKDELINGLLSGWNDIEQMGRNSYDPQECSFEEFIIRLFGANALIHDRPEPFPDGVLDVVYLYVVGDERFTDGTEPFKPDVLVTFAPGSGQEYCGMKVCLYFLS